MPRGLIPVRGVYRRFMSIEITSEMRTVDKRMRPGSARWRANGSGSGLFGATVWSLRAGVLDFGPLLFHKAIPARIAARGWPLKARQITVDGVGDEYAYAHNSEECSDRFQHDDDPNSQRLDLTAWVSTQSKGFLSKLNFESE